MEWELYPLDDGDEVVAVGFVLEPPDEAERSARPSRVQVYVDPAGKDEPAMSRAEEAIVDALERGVGAVHVGRLNRPSGRDLFFYAGDEAAATAAAAQLERQGLASSFEVTSDPEWSAYFEFLRPDDKQWQWILDRRVISELSERGDGLDTARSIRYSAEFETEAAARDFLNRCSDAGYTKDLLEQSEEDDVWIAECERTDAPDLDLIHERSWEVSELAAAAGGEYTGWESPVVS
jgi:regulator of ribonuclease activity B/uncharacterized protein DUF695